MTYIITAGNATTDLGIVGQTDTLIGARRIGRRVIKETLPNGDGTYRIKERINKVWAIIEEEQHCFGVWRRIEGLQ